MEVPFPYDTHTQVFSIQLVLEHRTDDVLSKYPIVGGFVWLVVVWYHLVMRISWCAHTLALPARCT